jgi:hypothetical protein
MGLGKHAVLIAMFAILAGCRSPVSSEALSLGVAPAAGPPSMDAGALGDADVTDAAVYTCSIVCNEAGTRWYYYDDNECADQKYGCTAGGITIAAGDTFVAATCTPNQVKCGTCMQAASAVDCSSPGCDMKTCSNSTTYTSLCVGKAVAAGCDDAGSVCHASTFCSGTPLRTDCYCQ